LILPKALGLAQGDDIDVPEVTLMFDDDDNESLFLTIDETARLLRINRRTLDNLRWNGKGPPARRHGGRIVYHRNEVLNWSQRRRTRKPPENTGNAAPSPGDDEPQHSRNDEPTHEPPSLPVEREP
jgi:hypothetical protein